MRESVRRRWSRGSKCGKSSNKTVFRCDKGMEKPFTNDSIEDVRNVPAKNSSCRSAKMWDGVCLLLELYAELCEVHSGSGTTQRGSFSKEQVSAWHQSIVIFFSHRIHKFKCWVCVCVCWGGGGSVSLFRRKRCETRSVANGPKLSEKNESILPSTCINRLLASHSAHVLFCLDVHGSVD